MTHDQSDDVDNTLQVRMVKQRNPALRAAMFSVNYGLARNSLVQGFAADMVNDVVSDLKTLYPDGVIERDPLTGCYNIVEGPQSDKA